MKLQRFSHHDRVRTIVQILREATVGMAEPAVLQIKKLYGPDPFLLLISCLLSLRAKDTAILPVAKNLFQLAQTPQEILSLSQDYLESLLHPIGFYRQKTRQITSVSQELLARFSGVVPQTKPELLSLKGVGPKTANLVLGQAFGVPGICVDVHVHRISNRLGLVYTQTPEETEQALESVLPKEYWIEWNTLLVTWGQHVCTPRSPRCSLCASAHLCERVGVTDAR